jgi:two-component system, response regulator, stage 0 sporulation protein F
LLKYPLKTKTFSAVPAGIHFAIQNDRKRIYEITNKMTMRNVFFLNNKSDKKITEIFGRTGEATENNRQAVMMAVDGVYRNGRYIENESDFMISNDYIMSIKNMGRRIIFGASVHPYREHKEMLAEVRRCLNAGAAFFFWIPSIQKIDLEDERCVPFYVCLAREDVPFVCYIGPDSRQRKTYEDTERYNNPKKLIKALEIGVSLVIADYPPSVNAGHVFQEEKELFNELVEMLRLSADKEWNLYVDISHYCRQGLTYFYEKVETCVQNGEINPKQLIYGCTFTGPLAEKDILKETNELGGIMSKSRNKDKAEKELKKILIIDDETMIQILMTELLSGDGNEIITCGSLKEAEEACSKNKFDLVITDLRLSGKDSVEGFQIISHVKNFSPDTKVMLMTGNSISGAREEALRRGAVCCIDKPFDILDVARKIYSFGIPLPELQKRGLL